MITAGRPRLDLTGQRFGRLVPIAYAGSVGRKRQQKAVWLCRCDCGRHHRVRASNLISDNTRSCGCLKAEVSTRQLQSLQRGLS
jgi:hypothetical protein